MPFEVPTLADARRLSRDGVTAALPAVDALPPNSPARIIADNNAGLAYLCLLFIANQAATFLPDTLEGAPRWGDILFGGRKAAAFASGSAAFTGIFGTLIPAGTQLIGTGATGAVTFATTDTITIGAEATSTAIQALDPGAAANLDAGTPLVLAVAISGADATATVIGLDGGTDAETDEQLRSHVLERLRKPPMGGDADDYVAWAKAVPGVTRAWCSPLEMGPGTVTVRFMMDVLRADQGGFPNPVDVATVQAAVDAQRPVTAADCFVVAPIRERVSFTVTNLVPDDLGTYAAIAANVEAMLAERAAPAQAINGVRVPAQTIFECWVSESISGTVGVESFDLTMADHSMPTNGHMAVLGDVVRG